MSNHIIGIDQSLTSTGYCESNVSNEYYNDLNEYVFLFNELLLLLKIKPTELIKINKESAKSTFNFLKYLETKSKYQIKNKVLIKEKYLILIKEQEKFINKYKKIYDKYQKIDLINMSTLLKTILEEFDTKTILKDLKIKNVTQKKYFKTFTQSLKLDLSISIKETFIILDNFIKDKPELIIDFNVDNFKTKLKGIQRLHSIKNMYNRKIDCLKSKNIICCMEGYAYNTTNTRSVFELGELGGMIKLYNFESNYSTLIVSPSSLKKFISYKGNSDKIEMKNAINEVFSLEFENDDIYDAFSLSLYLYVFPFLAFTEQIKNNFFKYEN